MNLGALLSFAASLLLAGMGVVFAFISRAPGWRRARLFTLIAFSAAAYSAVNMIFSTPGLDSRVMNALGRLNFLLGALHCAAWIPYAFSPSDQPWRALSPRLRWLSLFTIALGALCLIPDLAIRQEVRTIVLPGLGVIYRQFVTTIFGDVASAWFLVVLLFPFSRFLRSLRTGDPDAAVRVAGFSVFFACAVGEVLVTNGFIEFLYLGDVGFLAIVATLLVESIRRIMRDDAALQRLGAELSLEVDRRTRERDEARDALAHAERLTALGQLAAGVGHEISNPLTYVRSNLECFREALAVGELPPDAASLIEESLQGTTRMSRVVSDLRAYALPATERREPVRLEAVIASALELTASQLRHVAIVREHLGAVPRVEADALRLSQVFVNLLLNAAHAIEDAERQQPRVVLRAELNPAGRVVVEIEDNGVGVPEEMRSRLGEPYFSLRTRRGGTGLGLFVSRGILASFGGNLEFESEVGVGTVARVSLPAVSRFVEELPAPSSSSLKAPLHSAFLPVAAPHEREPAPHSTRTAAGAFAAGAEARPPRRVLIVDDDAAVARAISRMFSGDEVLVASDGVSALGILEAGGEFELVLCDVMMPGMSGPELYESFVHSHPAIVPKVVFVTGGATIPEVAAFLCQKGVRHLKKPFDRAAIEELFQDSIEGAAGAVKASPSRWLSA